MSEAKIDFREAMKALSDARYEAKPILHAQAIEKIEPLVEKIEAAIERLGDILDLGEFSFVPHVYEAFEKNDSLGHVGFTEKLGVIEFIETKGKRGAPSVREALPPRYTSKDGVPSYQQYDNTLRAGYLKPFEVAVKNVGKTASIEAFLFTRIVIKEGEEIPARAFLTALKDYVAAFIQVDYEQQMREVGAPPTADAPDFLQAAWKTAGDAAATELTECNQLLQEAWTDVEAIIAEIETMSSALGLRPAAQPQELQPTDLKPR